MNLHSNCFRSSIRAFALCLSAILLFAAHAQAQAPDDFNPNADSSVTSLALQADGKVLVGGGFTTIGAHTRNRIARLNADGSLDTSFNPNADGSVTSLALQADGKILVGGSFTTIGEQPRNRIARLNADGSLDTGFNPDANGYINSLAVQPDGKILVGGAFTTLGGQTRNRIARLNADGSLDTGFNPNTSNDVYSLALQPDGKILVGGLFTSLGGQTRNRIARLNSDGGLDTSFTPNADSSVTSLAVQADGKILVGGAFTTLGGQPRNRIARLNADGSLDSGFIPDANNHVVSLAVQVDGKILVGGAFTTLGGQPRNHIARLNPNASLDTSFNPNASNAVNSLALQADGKILVGGYFTTLGGQTRNYLARLTNDPATSTLAVTGTSQIDWMRGGSTPELSQVTFESWTGSAWANLGNPTRVSGGWRMNGLSLPASAWLRASGRASGGNYNGSSGIIAQSIAYGSGSFPDIGVTLEGGAPLISSAATVDFGSMEWIAVSPVTKTFTITNTGDAPLTNLAVSISGADSMDFTAGSLATSTLAPGASTTLPITFLPVETGGLGALLNIISNDADESPFVISLKGVMIHGETSFDPGSNNLVLALAVQADGKILVGGWFTTLGGQPRSRLARLNTDGSLDTGFDPDANNFINSLAVQPDGKILVGGVFTTIGGQTRNRIARLNSDGSLDTSFNPNADGSVTSLALQADGKILVGGVFTTLGGQTRNRIARLNADGSLDASFNPTADSTVWSLAVQQDGKILVGGQFATLGGQARNRIARLNADGSLDSGFNPDASSSVYSLALQSDGKILIGGDFASLSGQPCNRIARLNADGSLDSGFNPDANNNVFSLAVQADGKILVGGGFTTLGGQTRNRIARLNADGSLDTGFNPNASGEVDSLALQADGKILVGGQFTVIGGQPRNSIARLTNDPATSTLTVTGSNQIDWTRGGSTPELSQVTFESWTGSAWANLGNATRVSGGWRMNSLSLPASAWLRASGRASGGDYNGSSGIVAQSVAYGSGPFPDIGVTLEGGAPLISSAATVDYGSMEWSAISPVTKTFTITNTGDAPLTNLSVSISGADSVDFTAGSLATTTLAPGDSTTLPITFLPVETGGLGALLNIISNDADESPFRVSLKGNVIHADTSFDPDASGIVYSLALQPDGKILIGGQFTSVGGRTRNRIARLGADGSPDTGFNPDADNTVYSLAVQPDGQIIVGGLGYIKWLHPEGWDLGYMSANNTVNSLVVQPDGKILVGGSFTTLGGQTRNRIARLNADGSLDTDFNQNSSHTVNSLALQADGKILVGGQFTTLAGQTRNRLARLNADGSLDAGFNPNASSTVNCLAPQADGKILVGGQFTTLGGQPRNRIARLNADGSLDTGFDPISSNIVNSLALQADGKILVGGQFTTLAGQTRNRIARLNADGSLDSGFNPDANNNVFSLALQADGKVLVGGQFTVIGGQPRNRIARLTNDPATSTLTVTGSNQIDWTRGGSAPELSQVTFESWTGSDWSSLGTATRISGGWRMTGLNLPTGGHIRARGTTSGGQYNGSSGLIEEISDYSTPPQVSIDYVAVGNPYNPPDSTGYGSVDHVYKIAKYETTISQYCTFLNAVAKTDPYLLYSSEMATTYINGITRSGFAGSYYYEVVTGSANRPIGYINWFNAARFCNWMHNGQGNGDTETGVYLLNGAVSGVFTKNSGSTVWLPTEDEWYKAAYYDPTKNSGSGGYWLYPTRRNTMPGNASGMVGATNYWDGGSALSGAWKFSEVGAYGPDSVSYYGTNDQAGNAFEWNDAVIFGDERGLRGGAWNIPEDVLRSDVRNNSPPEGRTLNVGFRVASALTNMEAWRFAYFGGIDNTGDTADLADPDHDDLVNLLERAFNLNPTQPGRPILLADTGTTGLPLIRATEGPGGRTFSIQYLRRKASANPGLTYTPQFGSSMAESGPDGWSAATGTETVQSIDSEWERVTIEENATGQPKRFGRVRVSTSP